MSVVACWRCLGRELWMAAIACVPLVAIGCSGETPEPAETAATAPGDADTGAGNTPADAHGMPAPAADDLADSEDMDMSSSGPGAGIGSVAASGGPGSGHDSPVTRSGPGAGRGVTMPGEANDRPEGDDLAEADDLAASGSDQNGQQMTTGEWLRGLAAGVLESDEPAGPNGAAIEREAPGAPDGLPSLPGEIPGEIAAMPDEAGGAELEAAEGGEPGEEASGGSQAKQFDAGTAEHAVQQLVLKLQSGDTAGLPGLISERSNDRILKSLREGNADAALIEQAKTMSSGAELVSMRDGPGQKTFVVRNGAGQMLTIIAKREGDAYKVFDVKVTAPPRGRR